MILRFLQLALRGLASRTIPILIWEDDDRKSMFDLIKLCALGSSNVANNDYTVLLENKVSWEMLLFAGNKLAVRV